MQLAQLCRISAQAILPTSTDLAIKLLMERVWALSMEGFITTMPIFICLLSLNHDHQSWSIHLSSNFLYLCPNNNSSFNLLLRFLFSVCNAEKFRLSFFSWNSTYSFCDTRPKRQKISTRKYFYFSLSLFCNLCFF